MKLSNIPEGHKKSEAFFRDEEGLGKAKFFQKNKAFQKPENQKLAHLKNLKKKRTKDTISVLLPLISILIFSIIFLTLRTPTIGLAGHIDTPLYGLNGSIAITLQENIPADSYVNIQIDRYEMKINIIDFLKKANKPYNIYKGELITDDTYIVDFDHLGIIEGFEKGKHKITIEIVHDDKVLYRNEEVIEV